jgi:hypothetical protein
MERVVNRKYFLKLGASIYMQINARGTYVLGVTALSKTSL